MYTIEYRGKLQNKQPSITGNINDSCSNIKSITIEYADIDYFQYSDCYMSDCLGGFVNRTQRLYRNADKQYELVSIPNDGDINRMYIYAIINCDWMVLNVDGIDYNKLLVDTVDELQDLYTKLSDVEDTKEIEKIERRVKLLEYRIQTLNTKRRNGNKTLGSTLVFSNKPKKRV